VSEHREVTLASFVAQMRGGRMQSKLVCVVRGLARMFSMAVAALPIDNRVDDVIDISN
jgi:hypothetical protein